MVNIASACGTASAPPILRYRYGPGDVLVYDLVSDFTIRERDLMTDNVRVTEFQTIEEMTLSVTEGPTPDTVRLTLVIVRTAEEVDGVPVPVTAPESSVSVVVDSQGKILEASTTGFDELEEATGGPENVATAIFGESRNLGPELPDGPVALGESWSTTVTTPFYSTDMTLRSMHTLTEESDTDGRRVFTIETADAFDPIEIDSLEIMGYVDDLSPEEAADIAEAFERYDLWFGFRIEVLDAGGTTLLDPDAGVVVRYELNARFIAEMLSGQRSDPVVEGILEIEARSIRTLRP